MKGVQIIGVQIESRLISKSSALRTPDKIHKQFVATPDEVDQSFIYKRRPPIMPWEPGQRVLDFRMARLVPSDFESVSNSVEQNSPEARTLLRLRDGLSDRYVVYHGVHWARAERDGSVYGEIDFIVANDAGRLLAIEQKDTQIVATSGDIFARYAATAGAKGGGRGTDKSVTTQVNRNLNALRSQFARRYPGRALEIDHLLYLPSARLQGSLPSSVDPTRVVDGDRDGELVVVIEQLLEGLPTGWSSDRLEDLPRIEAFLSQKVGAAPHIGLLGRSAREVTTRLSGGLSMWASRLAMEPWRLRVKGTAGSGKTQLALQTLHQAHDMNQAALYVCFNRPLADAMKTLAPNPASVVTFHELARLAMTQAGRPAVDFSRPDAFSMLAQGFIEISPLLADTFDTLIIDEGQDFEQGWADSLLRMARPDARMLWLEDPEQSLYDRPTVHLPGWVGLASPVNYRSPQLLVEFINWLVLTNEPVEAGSAVLGFDPKWYVYGDSESPIPATEQALRDLRAEGFAPENIAVLSVHGLSSSRIAGTSGPSSLAGLSVRRQSGYAPEGTALWTGGELMVDTVFRFKGQAADAIVITEVDFEALTIRDRRRLFVALTRVRLQAVLVTTERAAIALRARLGG